MPESANLPESATLADLRQELHVSYSQIRTFLTCPTKFEHQYIRGTEPTHRPPALVFGGAIHHALATYYMHLMVPGDKIAEADLLDAFRTNWESVLDEPVPILFDDDRSEALVDQGVRVLRVFHENAATSVVLAVEQPFSVELVDPATGEVLEPKLVGAMDLVVQGDTRPEIVEHKTASKRYAQWSPLNYSLYATADANHPVRMKKIAVFSSRIIENRPSGMKTIMRTLMARSSLLRLNPQAASVALIASPSAPLRWHRIIP